jgi:hypothetical protein
MTMIQVYPIYQESNYPGAVYCYDPDDVFDALESADGIFLSIGKENLLLGQQIRIGRINKRLQEAIYSDQPEQEKQE